MERRTFLQTAAAIAGSPTDIPEAAVTAQQDRLHQLADRDDDERWHYETIRNTAYVRSGLVNADLGMLSDDLNGVIDTYTVTSDGIPFGFEVHSEDGKSVGTLVHLSAEQAEAVAVDLLEQAHAMRGDADERGN